ncbi:retrovirus-related Pol polyprotein from transposon 297 [Trichonephila clavipes]|nr:retrovirus-related Pol polyprotein from transposon 297 [Trichonephila clavipes]
MIADQMKKRYSPECKEHYLDIWEELISPEMLADKLEAFDNIRRSLPSGPRRHVKASETVNDGRQVSFRKPERPPKREYSHQVPNERSPLRCYDCGKQGVIKSMCPTCNLNGSQRTDVATNHISAYTAQSRSPRLTLIDITFCGIKGRVCADTGYSHSIAGERMFQIFKDKRLLFQETTLAMSLADGTDFLSSAGLVLDVKNTCWYSWDNPTHKYPFGEELDTPSIVEKMSSNTCQLREGEGESLTSVCVCAQKEKLNLLLESFQNVFEPGGEATHILEHHINMGNSSPISVPPYRMSPVKKEILRKEIEDLLEKDIIEECESPYGAPVVLLPKPNNQFRLCIDYRKLNEVTVSDTYSLPRMDDFLQEAKHTAYIFTIDLKSGYHQVNVKPADRDKTAFVCPFGTYRFKRMPFGLKNAPATFQRLIDIFRRGLPVLTYLDDIIIMSPTFEQHLADLEAVFKRLMAFKLRANREKCLFTCSSVKYLGLWITPQGVAAVAKWYRYRTVACFVTGSSPVPLKTRRVGQRCTLNLSRAETFSRCPRVAEQCDVNIQSINTPQGIEVDHEKTSAILGIPLPKNVKQLQSFLQTCSWYRKFIANFSEITRPLSNLTKKKAFWKWSEEEEKAFQTLKQCLVSPPILKQADFSKPFLIRTDASNYALGAVLLQGEDKVKPLIPLRKRSRPPKVPYFFSII